MPRYKVSAANMPEDVVEADNDVLAWANYCDRHRQWPNRAHSRVSVVSLDESKGEDDADGSGESQD